MISCCNCELKFAFKNIIVYFYHTASFYDVITVGAFTAYAQKFRHGGLKRLMKQVKDSSAEDSTSKTRLEKVKYLWNCA